VTLTARQEALVRLGKDRPLAHRVLFKHRHADKSPPFHDELIRDWHSAAPYIQDEVFRGGAKSTRAEEAIVIMAGFREFRNGLIIGDTLPRAIQRLHAIRMEFELNETLRKLFGDLVGESWSEDRLITSTGIMIQAMGRGQSLRGIKHLDQRPDLVFGDDIENRDDVKTPEARKKVWDWFTLDVLPALDPDHRVRIAATPLHPDSLSQRLKRAEDWVTHTYPIKYIDEDGQEQATWPDRFPLEWVNRVEASYRQQGQIQGFRQEYMCLAEAPETKAFKQEMFRIEPTVRTWEATYSMLDPARTTNKDSATTGYACWSWIGPRLVVWDAWAKRLMPDEIVDAAFKSYEEHREVWVGVEEDGLNQFLLQPIRTQMARRGVSLPLKSVRAPPGKLDFIRGLQPFFRAREVIFAKPVPDLQEQLIGFPTGAIDAPNALAYALRLRPGAPIYDSFGNRHVQEDMTPAPNTPLWLCLNATRSVVTGVVAQAIDGALRVYGDYVREGDPLLVTTDLLRDAQVDFGAKIRCVAGPSHFDRYNNVGLLQAIRKIPREVRNGVAPGSGRQIIENITTRERGHQPMLLVAPEAHWTLNGFAGGYARAMEKGGILAGYADEGPYRVLMEGLESFAGLLALGSTDEESAATLNAVTHDGRPYRSMLGNR
jgi:hypothetical protein